MPRFAANLSLMFNEVDFLDRFAAAAQAGFEAVEFLFPYAYDKERLRQALDDNGLSLALFNLHAGDWGAGERGLTALPDRAGEFQDSVSQAIDYALALGCRRLHALSGLVPAGIERDRAHRTYIDNLAFAARALKEHDLTLLIEPINTRDMPGIFLTGTDQAMDVMEEVGADNLYLQYDCYHMQIMEGDLCTTIERLADRIGHIQIAEVPGRHEPGRGEIDYGFVFAHLDRIGYHGWVGCEYVPAGDTVAGLAWFAPHAPRR